MERELRFTRQCSIIETELPQVLKQSYAVMNNLADFYITLLLSVFTGHEIQKCYSFSVTRKL